MCTVLVGDNLVITKTAVKSLSVAVGVLLELVTLKDGGVSTPRQSSKVLEIFLKILRPSKEGQKKVL